MEVKVLFLYLKRINPKVLITHIDLAYLSHEVLGSINSMTGSIIDDAADWLIHWWMHVLYQVVLVPLRTGIQYMPTCTCSMHFLLFIPAATAGGLVGVPPVPGTRVASSSSSCYYVRTYYYYCTDDCMLFLWRLHHLLSHQQSSSLNSHPSIACTTLLLLGPAGKSY